MAGFGPTKKMYLYIGLAFMMTFSMFILMRLSCRGRDYSQIASEAIPILEAVSRYARDKGDIPLVYSDVIPKYLESDGDVYEDNLWHEWSYRAARGSAIENASICISKNIGMYSRDVISYSIDIDRGVVRDGWYYISESLDYPLELHVSAHIDLSPVIGDPAQRTKDKK